VKKKSIFLFIILTLVLFFLRFNPFSTFKKPNVILIMIDALRWNHLGCLGYDKDTSPTLDYLARNGVLFTQVITQSSWTAPSVPSILTSTYVGRHKVYNFGDVISKDVVSIAQILKKRGYLTAAISEHTSPECIGDIDRGFDLFKSANAEEGEWIKNIDNFFKTAKEPFFIYFHFEGTHSPFTRIPESYHNLFPQEDYPDKELLISLSEFHEKNKLESGLIENGITNLAYYLSKYDAAIRYVDIQVAYLLNRLKKFKLEDNTLIIVTSDHGELLGEKGWYFFHGTSKLQEKEIKIGSIIYHKDNVKSGCIITQQVESIDIIPTILDYLKISKDKKMQGVSFYPLIKGKSGYDKKYAFSSFNRNCHVVRTNRYKLVVHLGETTELFDLSSDSGEGRNIYEDNTVVSSELMQVFNSYFRENFTPFSKGEVIELPEEEKEKLRNLGYAI